MKIKLLKPIEGYEEVAEYRKAEHMEWVLNSITNKAEIEHNPNLHGFQIVLTPIKQWRPATVQDVVDALGGVEIDARFRDNEQQSWRDGKLQGGFMHGNKLRFVRIDVTSWGICEVLR